VLSKAAASAPGEALMAGGHCLHRAAVLNVAKGCEESRAAR
jgi:hypothetical protein